MSDCGSPIDIDACVRVAAAQLGPPTLDQIARLNVILGGSGLAEAYWQAS